jgi:hypothetical protein
MSDHWEHRVIKVNLVNADPNVSQPVVVFDSLLGSNATPLTPGTPKAPELTYYLNTPAAHGGGHDFTSDWEVCGVISTGSMAFILLKRRV